MLILLLTGPVGIVVKLIMDNWDKITDFTIETFELIQQFFENIWDSITTWFSAKLDDIVSIVENGWAAVGKATLDVLGALIGYVSDLWKTISSTVENIIMILKDIIVSIWNNIKEQTVNIFNDIKGTASRIWNSISSFIIGVVRNVVKEFSNLYSSMVEIGGDIARGIIAGLFGIKAWFTFNFKKWIDDSILGFIRSYMKIGSPSKVMAKIGEQLTQGLYVGMGSIGSPGINIPQINVSGASAAPVNITINAGVGTDPYELGRSVSGAIDKYSRVSVNAGRYTAL